MPNIEQTISYIIYFYKIESKEISYCVYMWIRTQKKCFNVFVRVTKRNDQSVSSTMLIHKFHMVLQSFLNSLKQKRSPDSGSSVVNGKKITFCKCHLVDVKVCARCSILFKYFKNDTDTYIWYLSRKEKPFEILLSSRLSTFYHSMAFFSVSGHQFFLSFCCCESRRHTYAILMYTNPKICVLLRLAREKKETGTKKMDKGSLKKKIKHINKTGRFNVDK